MNLFKRLIIFEWYRFFLASTVLLLLLMSVANLISGFLRTQVTALEVVMNYIIELPSYSGKILPLSCLIASLFSINKLKNRNELTAIMALGYSRKKFILTIFQASCLVALSQLLIASYLQPFFKANKLLLMPNSIYKFRNLQSKGLRASTIGSGAIWYRSGNYFFSFSKYEPKKQILNNLSIYQFTDEHKLQLQIQAERASFIENRWVFENGISYQDLNTSNFPQAQPFSKTIFPLKESPKDFEQIESDITTLNIGKLKEYINVLDDAGINTAEYKMLFWDKISSALICIILALLSATGIFSPNRRTSSFGKQIFFVLSFTLFYWLIYSYTYELGQNSKLNPYVAAFSMPIFFSFFLGVFFYKNRKIR